MKVVGLIIKYVTALWIVLPHPLRVVLSVVMFLLIAAAFFFPVRWIIWGLVAVMAPLFNNGVELATARLEQISTALGISTVLFPAFILSTLMVGGLEYLRKHSVLEQVEATDAD